ncbi:hypothetical protein ERJ75_001311400 [Trypanosoma vivax]|nr:hypothetical protein ERJ75_001311400 [Trypanosoma vivax]
MRAHWQFAPLLVCALLCGRVLTSSSASSGVRTSDGNGITNETLCIWWRSQAEVSRYAVALRNSLLQKHKDLTEKYNRFVNERSNAGTAAQHSTVSKARNDIYKKYWEGFLLTNDRSREANAIVTRMVSLRSHMRRRWRPFNFSSCNATFYTPSQNLTLLYEQLAKEVKALFDQSRPHDLGRYGLSRIQEHLSSLSKTKGFDTLAAELEARYKSATEALERAQKEKQTFDEKVAVGCEMEKRLSIMRDTFLALRGIAGDVMTMEVGLSKMADELRTKAKALGVSVGMIRDTQHTKEAANKLLESISSALQRVLAAMYGSAEDSLHALLNYGTEFRRDISSCWSEMRVERTVLLQLVTEERRRHFDDFRLWREATEVMWSSVTNMTLPHAANCSAWKVHNCETLMEKANDLFEASRGSRKAVEAKLAEEIKALLEVEEEVRGELARLVAEEREQRRRKEAHDADAMRAVWLLEPTTGQGVGRMQRLLKEQKRRSQL